MLKVISCNLNGIRAAGRKGFFTWVKSQDPDFICVQETKAQMDDQLQAQFSLEGYYSYFSCAKKKGYSGVGIYSKNKPDIVEKILPEQEIINNEGRFIEATFGKLKIISLYLPSGTSSQERQDIKMQVLDYFYLQYLKENLDNSYYYIICGDWNIAHKKIDIKNWRQNQKNSGFLPEEREWLDKVFYNLGWIDAFRELNKNEDEYTWWSYRAKAREKNVGWRIDYQVVSPNFKDKICKVSVERENNFSDHAPLIMEYDFE